MKQIFIITSIVVFVLLLFFYVNKTDEVKLDLSSNNQILNNDGNVTNKIVEDKFIKDDYVSVDDKAIIKNNNETLESSVLLAVKKYVANNFKVTETSIVIDSIHGEDWPDGCLGLPEPDEACIEMIIFGYEVELKFLGQEHKFRTNHDGSVIREEF